MDKARKTAFVLWFREVRKEDKDVVGGKVASLGELYSAAKPLGILVPNGFAVSTSAYQYFLEKRGLKKPIQDQLKRLNTHSIRDLQERGGYIRQLIEKAQLPKELERDIARAYAELGRQVSVAVRSSAVAEDLDEASFAGQQETYLNVVGERDVLGAVKKAMASVFTDRAISYRKEKGFLETGGFAVGVQEMVRSDKAQSGVLFTLDLETGFDKVVVVNASYGLGEMIAGGEVTPDEFVVFKPTERIIGRARGAKRQKLVYGKKGTKKVAVSKKDQGAFCLGDKEVLQLAKWGVAIEKHFDKPMDIEWAKDGLSGKFYMVQARPETVHRAERKQRHQTYKLKEKGTVLASGMAVGTKIATGKVRIIHRVKDMGKLKKGEVLVASITDPDWEPVMKGAAAVVTDKGGRTSHAAIISREFGIPAIVGTGEATRKLKTGERVTVDCSSGDEGRVYKGTLKFETKDQQLGRIPKTKTKIMVNIGAPEEAFKAAWLPVQGVGLGRLEFLINSYIKIHPNALIDYATLKGSAKKEVDKLAFGYRDKKQFYVDKLAEGMAKIAAAFWPHEVIIRFSDFKTNEYRQLVGGERYEAVEQNPMLGWRGAARYYDTRFQEAFGLECKAMKNVREEMGLRNVTPMVPFCRTPEEGEKVVSLMGQYGLSKKENPNLRVYVMCEIPSNVILADEFLDVFDGMSIGSNDLTQLVLGIDRDAGPPAGGANENNEAVKRMIAQVIAACQRRGKYVGICGQAPSDYPEFTKFLVEEGIESISLNPDAVISTIMDIAAIEKEMEKK